MTRRTWFSSVWSTRAISVAEDRASEARMIWALCRSAKTFDWREILRSFTDSSSLNAKTNTDAGRAMPTSSFHDDTQAIVASRLVEVVDARYRLFSIRRGAVPTR